MTGVVWALGAMSGTSLDGIDAALLQTDGDAILAFGETAYRPYAPDERLALRAALGRWPGEAGVAAAAAVVDAAHAELLAPMPDAAVVGFHGQTLAHDPAGRRTHQVGDGDRLARALSRVVVWDFRGADVALGGEGAPLAPAFHRACAGWIGAERPLAVLNLGGVGNLTWIDPSTDDPARGLLAFDTGPANAPIDDVAARVGLDCDRDGALASAGRARADLVAGVLALPFFARTPPKSLDRGAFRAAGAAIDALTPPDAAATWVAVAAGSVAAGLARCPATPDRLLVTGGGRRNPTLMAAVARAVDVPVEPVEAAGLDGDMLEAQAFAFLAVRVQRGLPTSWPSTTGVAMAVGGGTVSDPAGLRGSLPLGPGQHQTRELARPR